MELTGTALNRYVYLRALASAQFGEIAVGLDADFFDGINGRVHLNGIDSPADVRIVGPIHRNDIVSGGNSVKGAGEAVVRCGSGGDDQVKPMLSNEGNLVIEGALRYQACDARVCYLAQAVPLKWRLHYDELDRQRVPPEMQRKAPDR